MSDAEKRIDGPELMPDAFEIELARAMRRVDAPEGFAARVMDRATNPTEQAEKVVVMRSRSRMVRMQSWAGGAIAAMLALGMFGAEQLHQRHEREEQTAMANQQFAMAVQVTDHALAQTREQLQRAGLRLGD